MVTPLGTAKQTVRKIEKCGEWLFLCEAASIANQECADASEALAVALQAINNWIKEQS